MWSLMSDNALISGTGKVGMEEVLGADKGPPNGIDSDLI